MSKECPKCKTTNYDSATVCSRCGNMFSDGAYYIGDSKTDIKTQKRKIDKSAKILISIIVAIICLIVFLVVFFVVSNSGAKDDKSVQDNLAGNINASTQQFSGSAVNSSGGEITGFHEQEVIDWGTYVPVESVSVNYDTLELDVGQTFQLQGAVLPEDATNKQIYWESSNVSIVEVENGVVTAKGKGNAQIYVYCSDNSSKYALCNVTVNNAKELIEPERTYDYGEFIVTAETFLSLRYGPSTDYDEIERIDKDEIVKVYAYKDDENGKKWAFIEYNGKLGWVFDRFLGDVPENITEE